MNKKETEVYIVKYLDNYFAEKGFKHKKSNREEIEYIKKLDKNNFVSFGLSTINYYDSHKLRFGFGKRLGVVEDIMAKINDRIPFTNPPYKKNSTTFGFGYNSYNGLNKDGCFGYMETEEQVKENVKKIIEFSENEAFPFIERLNNISEIDKLINGEKENFWETDWQKPFHLGHFYIRRLIVAKLSGREDYNKFIENHLQKIERLSKENNEEFDRNDLSEELVYCIKILNEIETE